MDGFNAYICPVCGLLYDEESADKSVEDTPIPFEDLDIDWACPVCDTPAEDFKPTKSDRVADVIDENQSK